MESRKSINTNENAKKWAIYGGLFGLGIGWGIGKLKSNYLNIVGLPHRGLITAHAVVGLVTGATAGSLTRSSIGFFGAKNNQHVCQSNIIIDKNKEPQHTKQASFKN
jgi:hypothetical protein